MSNDAGSHSYNKSALEIKSTSYNVPILVAFSAELKQIKVLLEEKIAQAPEFFKNSPILIDLKEINKKKQNIDLTALIELILENKLIPIGLSGGLEEQNELALEKNIPVHTIRHTNSIISEPTQAVPENSKLSADDPVPDTVDSVFVSLPVRSGQRIYSKGDLTILSHVSAGAEVMAEGNIHIYGSLRGRALAGVQGNAGSHIFCSNLQAELISIAGNYKISEELQEIMNPVHIFLRDQALIIDDL